MDNSAEESTNHLLVFMYNQTPYFKAVKLYFLSCIPFESIKDVLK
ncbi:hypothetical protein BAXH7_03832 [Bacillus amyloliquefaciens XH7]|nr:hypothetical protein BAXH7_03832 [Bacillus amyloliquefaciens XH7]QBG58175.1 hypothetical protein D2M30_3876 [Bacillus amyloliquefaciens]